LNFKFLTAASALALGCLSTPAVAQHKHMPGMEMPAPKKPAAKKPVAKKPVAKKPAAKSKQQTPAPATPVKHQHRDAASAT
jgi:hypothetical protein